MVETGGFILIDREVSSKPFRRIDANSVNWILEKHLFYMETLYCGKFPVIRVADFCFRRPIAIICWFDSTWVLLDVLNARMWLYLDHCGDRLVRFRLGAGTPSTCLLVILRCCCQASEVTKSNHLIQPFDESEKKIMQHTIHYTAGDAAYCNPTYFLPQYCNYA